MYFCCPETRGHSLEEIDLIFMADTLKNTQAAQTLRNEDAQAAAVAASKEPSVSTEAADPTP